jgi:formylglycine-generating enzyme required for sulfatase activity
METKPKTGPYILDDLPAQRDTLDFQPYVNTLVNLVQSPNTNTPLTIGVFGGWGSGKTSLMGMVRSGLPGHYRIAWFDAWKYEKETDLWRALLLHVLNALQEALPKKDRNQADEAALARLEELRTSLYRAEEREVVGGLQVNWGKLASGVAQGSLQIGLSMLPVVGTLTKMVEKLQEEGATTATEKLIQAIQRERTKIYIDHVQFLEQFQAKFKDLVKQYVLDKKSRLVVFVDDLDRCLPDKAVLVLEAIKLFLDVPGCIFVLGLDDKVIARGVEIKYRQLGLVSGAGEPQEQQLIFDGARYLEKIIQLPFQLPPIDHQNLEKFVQSLVATWPHEECPKVFAAGLGGNPRQVKRTVNVFLLLSGLAQEKGLDEIHPIRLAKLVVIQNTHPTLYDFLRDDNHRYLQELETYFLNETRPERAEGAEMPEKAAAVELSPALEPYLRRRGIAAVRRVLALYPQQTEFNFKPLSPDQLRSYFTLAQRAEAPQVAPAVPTSQAQAASLASEGALAPQMVRIPAGPFRMGSSEEHIQKMIAAGTDKSWVERERPQHTLELPDYEIGRYPVTNREYQAFVRLAGQRPPRDWDGDLYPEGKGDHPVVNVTWHDAVAFCAWLSKETGEKYRLPSEAEWEKAARGEDGRIYPWGDAWDPLKCNTSEKGPGGTTPVGQYSPVGGDSPYGCADMVGNVWEWTGSLYKPYHYDPQDGREQLDAPGSRVLRGGSWPDSQNLARAARRSTATLRSCSTSLVFVAPAHPSPEILVSGLLEF